MDIGRLLDPEALAHELDAALNDNRRSPAFIMPSGSGDQLSTVKAQFRSFILLIVHIGYISRRKQPDYNDFATARRSGALKWLTGVFRDSALTSGIPASIGSVSTNRIARIAVRASRKTVKADAVGNPSEIDASHIGWAVLDSGIEARHPAFRRLKRDGTPFDTPYSLHRRGKRNIVVNQTRVVRT